MADLSDEPGKASKLLKRNKNTEVRFHSRNNFGKLGKLKGHSATQHDVNTHQTSLGSEKQETDATLSKLGSPQNLGKIVR